MDGLLLSGARVTKNTSTTIYSGLNQLFIKASVRSTFSRKILPKAGYASKIRVRMRDRVFPNHMNYFGITGQTS